MGVRLGLDAKLYRNTGTYAAPVWNEVKNVKDLTLNLEAGEADVTTRGNNGWRATLATLKDGSVEFEMCGTRPRTTSRNGSSRNYVEFTERGHGPEPRGRQDVSSAGRGIPLGAAHRPQGLVARAFVARPRPGAAPRAFGRPGREPGQRGRFGRPRCRPVAADPPPGRPGQEGRQAGASGGLSSSRGADP
jgi:hypothetical protein